MGADVSVGAGVLVGPAVSLGVGISVGMGVSSGMGVTSGVDVFSDVGVFSGMDVSVATGIDDGITGIGDGGTGIGDGDSAIVGSGGASVATTAVSLGTTGVALISRVIDGVTLVSNGLVVGSLFRASPRPTVKMSSRVIPTSSPPIRSIASGLGLFDCLAVCTFLFGGSGRVILIAGCESVCGRGLVGTLAAESLGCITGGGVGRVGVAVMGVV